MLEVLEPTQDPGWGLSHEGYNVLSESAFEGAGLARRAYAYAYHPAYSYGYEAACGSHVTSRRYQDALELIGQLGLHDATGWPERMVAMLNVQTSSLVQL